jgi:hypothetical protein
MLFDLPDDETLYAALCARDKRYEIRPLLVWLRQGFFAGSAALRQQHTAKIAIFLRQLQHVLRRAIVRANAVIQQAPSHPRPRSCNIFWRRWNMTPRVDGARQISKKWGMICPQHGGCSNGISG